MKVVTLWLLRFFVKNYKNVRDTKIRTACGSFASFIGIACNTLLVAGKITAGLVSGSVSIIADGINNLSDAASSIITSVGFKLASKTPDKKHPFGHARFEYIAGLTVAVIVLVMGFELGKNSFEKIIKPTPVSFGFISFLVLISSILLKVWMTLFNRDVGKHINSTSLKAASVDSRNDAIATTAVLIAAVLTYYTKLNLDGYMGFGIAFFIVYSGVGLIKDTLNPLLGEAPSPEFITYLVDKITSYEGVLGTHDLIVHDYGPNRRFASAHVEISTDLDVLISHDIIDKIERDFLKNDGIHLIIHYDPIMTSEQVFNARAWVEQQVKMIDSRLSIHDLCLIDCPDHTDYVFDILIPPGSEIPEDKLRLHVEKAVQHGDKPIHVIITIDHSYAPTPK